jgi:nitrogen fixation protein
MMAMTNHSLIALSDREEPVLLAWPTQDNAGGFIRFEKAADWRAFVESLSIDTRIPEIVRAKFARAQTLYLLGWVDFSVVKAGELAALVALELALMDRYGGRISKNKRSFAALLKYMVDADGLTDAQIRMAVRCGGTALGQLTGESRPTLAERRNSLAHGDPFDGLPTGGLLELVRDLINFAYRDA